jgi:hypothetical protein
VPYTDGCLSPTQGSHALVVQSTLILTLQKTTVEAIRSQRNVTLHLEGTDIKSDPPTWSVASTLPSWLTLAVSSATIHLPEIDQGRLAPQGGSWQLDLPVFCSPANLPERTEPYSHDFVVHVNAQRAQNITVPIRAYVQAMPVAAFSMWGGVELPSKCVEPAEGSAYPQTVTDRVLPDGLLRGAVMHLLLGDEVFLPFQSCDIDAIPIAHSLPSPYDTRSFTAQLVPDDQEDAYELGLTYSGKGAYFVRLTSLRLGSFTLQLALDGQAVSTSVPVLIVCPSGSFENAKGVCASCGDFAFPPRCQSPGVTLETLDLSPGTWRATFNSTVIRACVRSSGCMGGPGNATSANSDSYCSTGHTGPLCSACVMDYYWGFGQQCVECGDKGVSGGVLLTLVALIVAALSLSWWFRRRMQLGCQLYVHQFFRLFSGARVKIVWTTYQIIGSVAWGVNVSWPEPFKSFTSGLQALYFVAVGGECFSPGYNYYIKLLLMTLWPIVVALLIFATMAARVTLSGAKADAAKRKQLIKRGHWGAFIVLCYLIMPTNSVYLFRIFECDTGFGVDGSVEVLRADYTLQCWGTEHYAMITYALVMICVYPVGINLLFLTLLIRNREAINPSRGTMSASIIDRQSQPQIKYLSFIFRHYKPSCFMFELVESARRLMLGGVYIFFSNSDAVNCFASFVVALIFFFIIREVMPFVSQTDNTLLIVAQLQIILTFIGGFLLAGRPFELDESLLGWVLLLFDLAVVLVAVWMQHKHGSSTVQTELQVLQYSVHTHACVYTRCVYSLHMSCS